MATPQKFTWSPSPWQIATVLGFCVIQTIAVVGYIHAQFETFRSVDSDIRSRVTAVETSNDFLRAGIVRIEGKLDKIGERIESLHR